MSKQVDEQKQHLQASLASVALCSVVPWRSLLVWLSVHVVKCMGLDIYIYGGPGPRAQTGQAGAY